ncbi:MAG: ParB/RepB/Spo0J family partition protein [bacterium]
MPSGLGRGLGSLIPQKDEQEKTSVNRSNIDVGNNGMLEVPVEMIHANSGQPRKYFKEEPLEGLADSIKTHGIIQPLVVLEKDGRYELIAGERRLRAAKMVGLKKVPIVIKEATEKKKLEMSLIENIQRENLNPIELAKAYKELLDKFKITHEELGKRLGKSRPVISNTLRFLQLPENIQQALAEKKINDGQGLSLAALRTEKEQQEMFLMMIKGELPGKKAREQTHAAGGSKQGRIRKDKYDDQRVDSFQKFFSTKAKLIRNQKGGGKMIVEFGSNEELDEMIKKLG